MKALNICAQFGIAVQVNIKYPSDKTSYLQIMMEKMEAAVEDLKDVPVLLGWYLWDEPTVREYCGGDNLTQSSLKPSYIKVKLKAGDACLLQVKNLLIEV